MGKWGRSFLCGLERSRPDGVDLPTNSASASDMSFIQHLALRSALLLSVLTALFTLAGCSGAEDPPSDWMAGGATGFLPLGNATGPCEPDTEAACTTTIEQVTGVTSCFYGVQYCVDGLWSECLDVDAPVPD